MKPVLPDDVFQALETELGISLPKSIGMDTLACLESADKGNIDAALIMGGNLYSASPNTHWAGQSMDKIGFKLFMTTTLNQGHVFACDNSESLVLPVVARDEESQSTTQESMFNYVRLSDGGITRIADARSEVSILVDLFAKVLKPEQTLGLDINEFSSHQTIRETIAKIIPGLEALGDIGVAKREFHIKNRLMHTPVFNTPSGRAQFVVHEFDGLLEQAPNAFTLMSVRSEGQFNSIIYEENDSYRGIDQRWSIMMNGQDIASIGLKKGDLVDVVSEHGQMKAVAFYPFDIPCGNVMAYYPEANVLIGRQRDPRSQTPAFKSVSVTIKKSE